MKKANKFITLERGRTNYCIFMSANSLFLNFELPLDNNGIYCLNVGM